MYVVMDQRTVQSIYEVLQQQVLEQTDFACPAIALPKQLTTQGCSNQAAFAETRLALHVPC